MHVNCSDCQSSKGKVYVEESLVEGVAENGWGLEKDCNKSTCSLLKLAVFNSRVEDRLTIVPDKMNQPCDSDFLTPAQPSVKELVCMTNDLRVVHTCVDLVNEPR
jgi:hypothetical protein